LQVFCSPPILALSETLSTELGKRLQRESKDNAVLATLGGYLSCSLNVTYSYRTPSTFPMWISNNLSTKKSSQSILPSPTGVYSLGTMTKYIKDESRNRELVLKIWYPSIKLGRENVEAPYADRKTANASNGI
jgi:hypothetical protein